MCYKRMISLAFSKQNIKLGLVVDTIIEAIARLEFEDGSPPWRLLGPLERPHLTYDQYQTPLGVWVGPGGSLVVIGTLLSD